MCEFAQVCVCVWPPHLQQLVPNTDVSVFGSGTPGADAHHKDTEAGAVAVPRQAQAQTLALFVQLHTQQLPAQLPVAQPDPL